jgi:endonuclease/exonuclease/phosphatase family metal-dependent hydrolase
MSLGILRLRLVLCALLTASLACSSAQAQLRIVSYNTATAQAAGGTQTARLPHASTVLEAIGLESINDIAKPIDVLLLQEQFNMQLTTQSFVDVLNDLYDPVNRTMYARSQVNGDISNDFFGSGGRPGLVYNTQTVQLLGEAQFGNVGTEANQHPRASMRYHFGLVGYDSTAEFYAYSSHFSAGVVSQRTAEAQAIRTSADALGEGTHIIYAGDFNINTSNTAPYTHLLSSGNGQAFDPIDTPGSWRDNQFINGVDIRHVHTQSPAGNGEGIPGFAEAGVDDRFDFQLVTNEFLDGEGLSYIPGSYHAFGNNGTHTINESINTGTGAAPSVLAALMANSDHLPVVADYQLPAKMMASLAAVPMTVMQGATVGIDVFVENIANVVASSGADELDYTISVAGSLLGSASGSILALAGVDTKQIFLDTSTAGLRTGMVTVATQSQAAANSLYEFPIEFFVGNFLEADFNQDGNVDGLDLAEWQAAFGVTANADADSDGDSDGRDFLIWQRQYGQSSLPLVAGSMTTVPEPTSLLLMASFACVWVVSRRPQAV